MRVLFLAPSTFLLARQNDDRGRGSGVENASIESQRGGEKKRASKKFVDILWKYFKIMFSYGDETGYKVL